jgi:hypothetical protein
VTDTGEPGFDVFVAAPAPRRVRNGAGVGRRRNPRRADRRCHSPEAGVPVFRRDMTTGQSRFEAGIESRAISFSKAATSGGR